MSSRTGRLSDELYAYMLKWGAKEPDAVRALREDTHKLEEDGWQSSQEQVQFLAVLAGAIGAKRFLEVGTFTGYCTLRMAMALPDDGEVVALDITDEFVEKAGRKHWAAAGVENKIDFRIGAATEILETLISEGQSGTFDMAFIDANKKDYPAYFDHCATLVKPNGLVLIDNVFWGGRVADPTEDAKSTRGIREATQRAAEHPDFEVSMIPIGDGLVMARKIGG